MPRDILTIAAAIKTLYDSVYNINGEENDFTEMKLHKLLYFSQKKHFENFGEWLFDDEFVGWVHGPVNRKVRAMFCLLDKNSEELTLEEEYTLREVIYDYGKYSAGYLRNLSHKDNAYKKSRIGMNEDEPGDRVILKDDIVMDIPSNDCDPFFDSEVY